jgi:hypothetical protein
LVKLPAVAVGNFTKKRRRPDAPRGAAQSGDATSFVRVEEDGAYGKTVLTV